MTAKGKGGYKLRKHGLTGLPEFAVYRSMVWRCRKHPDYAGRGIHVCQEWLDDPRKFIEFMGPRPSPLHEIDRIDNDGHYEPGNVRWATRAQNKRNHRRNVWITAFGETRCAQDWARALRTTSGTIMHRLARGWTPEKAVSTPAGRGVPAGRPRLSFEYDGEQVSLVELARRTGIKKATLYQRLVLFRQPLSQALRPVAEAKRR